MILCQPDNKKGCSACCGLFNCNDISRDNLSKYLSCIKQRLLKEKKNKDEYSFSTEGIRDIGSHICPYQGFVGEFRPGCTIHPTVNKKDLRNISLFGEKICDSFLCPAHEILNEKHKNILINNIDDWYFYSIAIIDPESFIWIIEILESEFNINFMNKISNDSPASLFLITCLRIHSNYLQNYRLPVFHYSISEYNHSKKDFSISGDTETINKEKSEIHSEIKKLINRPK